MYKETFLGKLPFMNVTVQKFPNLNPLLKIKGPPREHNAMGNMPINLISINRNVVRIKKSCNALIRH